MEDEIFTIKVCLVGVHFIQEAFVKIHIPMSMSEHIYLSIASIQVS